MTTTTSQPDLQAELEVLTRRLRHSEPLNTLAGVMLTPSAARRIAVKAAMLGTDKSALHRLALIRFWQQEFGEDLMEFFA